jgi:type IV pilus assembly protein PilA
MLSKILGKSRGLTLIELLIVIGILAILMAGIIVAINPGRQFAQARDAQRLSNVEAILNAVNQNMIDNRGTFTCTPGALPSAPANMGSDTAGGDYDICDCLVDDYLATMPVDPDPSVGSYTDCATYDTGYNISQDSTSGRITVSASGELTSVISVTR